MKLLIVPSQAGKKEEAEHNSIQTFKDRAVETMMTEGRNSIQGESRKLSKRRNELSPVEMDHKA